MHAMTRGKPLSGQGGEGGKVRWGTRRYDGDDGIFSLILPCFGFVRFLLFFGALLCTLCVGKGAVATHACSVACAQHVRM